MKRPESLNDMVRWPVTIPGALDMDGTDPALSNELADIVVSVFGGVYVPLDVRYGIAHAVLRAGFTKPETHDSGREDER